MSVANVFEPEFDSEADREGFTYRRARIGWQAGSERLGASLYEVAPGETIFPYHWHSANEEMLIVLSGRPSVADPRGLARAAPRARSSPSSAAPEGAHQISNWSDEPVRFLLVSEMNAPELAGYPDSGQARHRGPPAGLARRPRRGLRLRFAARTRSTTGRASRSPSGPMAD